MPKQLKDEPYLREILVDFLKAYRRPWRHNPQACDFASIIRARSCTMEEVQEYAKTLNIVPEPGDPSDSPFFTLQHWYPRTWDEWARDKDGAVPDDMYADQEESAEIADTREFSISFKPVLPKFADEYSFFDKPRCANEINFRLYGSDEYLAEVFPKSSGRNFERAISGLASFERDWRVGRNGLVKLVKHVFSERRDIPAAESIMFSWLADLGWKPKLSPPGLLAKQVYKQLDGFPSILKNETVLGLLEHMNGGLVQRDGGPVGQNKTGQERDLSVAEVKNRLEASGSRGSPHDYLVSKGVFKLGVRVQCLQCLRNSWFSLDDIRDSLTCPKCLRVFPAIGNLDNATWSYKTVGPFSVPNYADGAFSVLLTLDLFNERHLTTLRTTPVLSFTAEAPNKKSIEADFASFWQESLFGENRDGVMFGECKTYGRFEKKDFDRMRYLASTFPGAVLVFSTLRKSLTAQEVAGITGIARAGRKYWKAERPVNPTMILTGTELLHWSGPPSCWDEATRNNFSRAIGVISLCNATQQIYLGLPSWELEWREKREKKRQRHALRLRIERERENPPPDPERVFG